MFKKYIQKLNIYTVLVLAIILFAIIVFAKNSNDYFETFTTADEAATFNNITKWKFDKTDPTQSWDEWHAIKQNGFNTSCKDLGLTTPNSKMTISFMFRCDSGSTHWRNIFHFTTSGENYGDTESRIPAMWVFPDSTNRLHIRYSTNRSSNDGHDDVVRPMNVPEFLSFVFDDHTFSFYVDGTFVFSESYYYIIKRQPNTTFYIGDPWYYTNDLFIKNFTIYNGALTGQNISDIYSDLTKVPVGTAANLMKLARNFENISKPSWIFPETEKEFRSIRYATVPWADLKIPDFKNMAFSFWINLVGEVQDNYGFFYLLGKNTGSDRSDRPLSIEMAVKNGELCVRNIHDLVNYYFKTPISKPTWITVSFSPGAEHFYVNGWPTGSSISNNKYAPPGETSLLVLGQGAKGIFIKDLKFYDHSLTETGISTLYQGLTKELV